MNYSKKRERTDSDDVARKPTRTRPRKLTESRLGMKVLCKTPASLSVRSDTPNSLREGKNFSFLFQFRSANHQFALSTGNGRG